MKELCIKRSTFDQIVGYGSWSVITCALVFMLAINTIEIKNFYEGETLVNIGNGLNPYFIKMPGYCYKTILTDGERCGLAPFSTINLFLWVATAINFGIIGLRIYYKQQKVKFKWCVKDGATE